VNFLRLLRLYRNRAEGECENDGEDSPPFWIFDFGF
jgi:hypothetical protein